MDGNRRRLLVGLRQWLVDLDQAGGQWLDVPAGALAGPGGGAGGGSAGAMAAAEPADGGPASLAEVRRDLGDCRRCRLHRGRSNIVFGVGAPTAPLMLVGEGPGRDEDLQAEPFVGEAGKLLNRMLGAMGLSRQQVYIANIVKCRPPRNRDPEADEVAACSPFLRAQLRLVKPRVVVALGRCAAQTLLETNQRIGELRGRWCSWEGVDLMPTFHPAFLLRSPERKVDVWHDLQAVMKKLSSPPG